MTPQTKNIFSALVQQFVTIVCGFILPREIILHYGSELNGLYHSASQFLSYVAFFDFGIGAVIPAALYIPLVEKDYDRISTIISSGYKIFHKLALLTAVYLIVLIFMFPKNSFWILITIGSGSIIHYIAGTPERLLLISDQKGYLIYALSTFSSILSLLFQIKLIRSGFSLPAVKSIGTFAGVVQIIFICNYVQRHYKINRKISYSSEPIPQKWYGIAQHIAWFVLENTDIFLLTIFTTFKEVSVYSVYFIVISGVRRVFSAITYNVQPKLGELIAKNEHEKLNLFFTKFERYIHLTSVLCFTGLSLTIIPFVRIYTKGVSDADYTRPLFAVLMSLAYGCQSLREPYNKLILASGHFKQTQINYIVATILNLVISLATVKKFGLEGVAAGTLIAMLYQLFYMAGYDSKFLLKRSIWKFFRLLLIDFAIIFVIIFATKIFDFNFERIFSLLLKSLR